MKDDSEMSNVPRLPAGRKSLISDAREYCIKRYFFSESGNAFVIAVIVAVILMTVLIVGVLLVRQQVNLVSGSRRKSEALSVAEAGLDAAIWRLERNQTLDTGTVITDYNTQGQYSATVTKINDSTYQIKSIGTNTSTNVQRAVRADVYYINLSRSIATFSGANGGGDVTGSINIWGPFYTSGDLSFTGSVEAHNLPQTTGNPFMVFGDLNLLSNGVHIGRDDSLMNVFVKGNIPYRQENVHSLISKNVPEVSLPTIVKSQFLSAAEANDNAVSSGNVTLNSTDVNFNHFNYNGTTKTLTTEGVVYIKGDLRIEKSIGYQHTSGSKQATIFVDGTIYINGEVLAPTGTYPGDSSLALINEDRKNADGSDIADDIYITYSGSKTKVQSFIYTAGRCRIAKQLTVEGSVIVNDLYLDQVPDLMAPSESAINNYPYLYPGKDLAILTTANWREVAP